LFIELLWPIRFEVAIVSIGNNNNIKPDWPESSLKKKCKVKPDWSKSTT